MLVSVHRCSTSSLLSDYSGKPVCLVWAEGHSYGCHGQWVDKSPSAWGEQLFVLNQQRRGHTCPQVKIFTLHFLFKTVKCQPVFVIWKVSLFGSFELVNTGKIFSQIQFESNMIHRNMYEYHNNQLKHLQEPSCCFHISHELILSNFVFYIHKFYYLVWHFCDFQIENYWTWGWAGPSGSRVHSTRVSPASPPKGAGSQTVPDQQAPGCSWLHQRPGPLTTTCQPAPAPPTLQRHQPGSQALPEGGCRGPPQAEGQRGSLCWANVWELLPGGEGSPSLQSCPQRLAVSVHV